MMTEISVPQAAGRVVHTVVHQQRHQVTGDLQQTQQLLTHLAAVWPVVPASSVSASTSKAGTPFGQSPWGQNQFVYLKAGHGHPFFNQVFASIKGYYEFYGQEAFPVREDDVVSITLVPGPDLSRREDEYVFETATGETHVFSLVTPMQPQGFPHAPFFQPFR